MLHIIFQNDSVLPMFSFRARFSNVHKEPFSDIVFIVCVCVFFSFWLWSHINKSKTEAQSATLHQNNVPNPPSRSDCLHCYVDGGYWCDWKKSLEIALLIAISSFVRKVMIFPYLSFPPLCANNRLIWKHSIWRRLSSPLIALFPPQRIFLLTKWLLFRESIH